MTKKVESTTLKITLRTILIAIALVIVIGGIGGIAAMQLFTPTLPPLTSDGKQQFITTVQEVTVSPNTQSASLVEKLQRSVVLLVNAEGSEITPLGTGAVITNDGLIVSTLRPPNGGVRAMDSSGRILPINTVGTDELYDLTYYQLNEGVVPPFELASQNAPVSSELLALSISPSSISARAQSWQLVEYATPEASLPDGIMRVGIFDRPLSSSFEGAILINEEGKLTGLVSDPGNSRGLAVDAVRSSITRIAANKREENPFEKWGVSMQYGFVFNTEKQEHVFAVTVRDVVPGSPAAIAGIRRGDTLTNIQSNELTWNTDITSLLEASDTLSLTVQRGANTEEVTLNTPAPTDT